MKKHSETPKKLLTGKQEKNVLTTWDAENIVKQAMISKWREMMTAHGNGASIWGIHQLMPDEQ